MAENDLFLAQVWNYKKQFKMKLFNTSTNIEIYRIII